MGLSLKESLEAMSVNTTYVQSNSIPSPIARMANPETEPEITVDMDTRIVTVPHELQNIGVVSDNNAETVYIRMPSTTFDGRPLTDKTVYIEYINAGREYNTYQITEVEVEDGTIKLGWTIDNNVTRYAGTVSFQISFELDTDYKWSTVPATINILAGLDINSTIPSSETAIVSALFDRMNKLEAIIDNYTSSIDKISDNLIDIQEQINTLQQDIDYLKNQVVYILDDIE